MTGPIKLAQIFLINKQAHMNDFVGILATHDYVEPRPRALPFSGTSQPVIDYDEEEQEDILIKDLKRLSIRQYRHRHQYTSSIYTSIYIYIHASSPTSSSVRHFFLRPREGGVVTVTSRYSIKQRPNSNKQYIHIYIYIKPQRVIFGAIIRIGVTVI